MFAWPWLTDHVCHCIQILGWVYYCQVSNWILTSLGECHLYILLFENEWKCYFTTVQKNNVLGKPLYSFSSHLFIIKLEHWKWTKGFLYTCTGITDCYDMCKMINNSTITIVNPSLFLMLTLALLSSNFTMHFFCLK